MSPSETPISRFDHSSWTEALPDTAERAMMALEAGRVLFLPALRAAVLPEESRLFTPSILGSSKNASYDPAADRLGGTTATGDDADLLRAFIARFSDQAARLVHALFPRYQVAIARGRASFRPAEISGRVSSWRKDDTRLHVDSFPATPTGGRRILRVFSNVNPEGRARSWRVSGDFQTTAARFASTLRLPMPGSGRLLALLGVTKSVRTPYDALMLQLHDRMKADEEFQRTAPQEAFDFPAGSTWMAFTDEVGHAAMAGQYQLEQTFLVPVASMERPERSPLRILEALKGRQLAREG